MRTKTINLYQFSELTETAQQKAIEKLYDINVNYDWYESVYEDAANIYLKITGFDIDRASYCKGEFINSAAETAEAIKENHGDHCETYKTAQTFLNDWSNLVEKFSNGIEEDKVQEGKEEEFDEEADELEDEFLKSLCEDYRIMLSNEYDYQTSKEAIIETINANEYDFDEEGNLI
jgi:hypothetical protein